LFEENSGRLITACAYNCALFESEFREVYSRCRRADEILARADYVAVPTGQTYYFQQDHEGNVTHLTNANGT
jgi:hypothetical protein